MIASKLLISSTRNSPLSSCMRAPLSSQKFVTQNTNLLASVPKRNFFCKKEEENNKSWYAQESHFVRFSKDNKGNDRALLHVRFNQLGDFLRDHPHYRVVALLCMPDYHGLVAYLESTK